VINTFKQGSPRSDQENNRKWSEPVSALIGSAVRVAMAPGHHIGPAQGSVPLPPPFKSQRFRTQSLCYSYTTDSRQLVLKIKNALGCFFLRERECCPVQKYNTRNMLLKNKKQHKID